MVFSRIFKRKLLAEISIVAPLFFLLVAFIPMQYRYHKFLKPVKKLVLNFKTSLPMFFEKMVFYSFSDILLLTLFMIFYFKYRNSCRSLFWGKFTKFLSIYFIIALISIISSEQKYFLLQYYRLAQLILSSLIFYFLSNGFLTNVIKEPLKTFSVITVMLSLFETLVASVQYFTQHAIGLKYFGELNFSAKGVSPSSIFVPDGSLWIFDHLLFPGTAKVIARAYGTFSDPNILGGYLAISCICSFYLFFKKQSRAWKYFISLAIFFQIFGIIISYSRSAFFGLIIAFIFFVFLFFMEFMKSKNSIHFKLLKQLSFVFVFSFLLILGLFHHQILNRGGMMNYQKTTAEFADNERKVYQEMAAKMIVNKPVLGVGFNSFSIEMKKLSDQKVPEIFSHPVHNVFLLIASESGIVALLFFCLAIFFPLINLIKDFSSLESKSLLVMMTFFIFISGCSHYPFSWTSGQLLMFFLLGMIGYYAKIQDPITQNALPKYAPKEGLT